MSINLRKPPFNFGAYAQKYPWIVQCEEFNCFWTTAHTTEEKAKKVEKGHPCPLKGPTRYNMKGKSIIEKLWDELDNEFDEIYTKKFAGEDSKWNEGRCRGIAWCIVEMAGPYFTEADQVMRQGVKRYKIRKGEMEYEPTPTYDYQPPPPSDVHPKPRTEPSKLGTQLTLSGMSAAEQRAVDRLDEKTKAAIKRAVQQNMLPVEKLATAYKISSKAVRILAET